MENDSGDSFCITDTEGWDIPGYWSPDNRKINCSQLVTLDDYSIWIIDVESGNMEKIDVENKEKVDLLLDHGLLTERVFTFYRI